MNVLTICPIVHSFIKAPRPIFAYILLLVCRSYFCKSHAVGFYVSILGIRSTFRPPTFINFTPPIFYISILSAYSFLGPALL